MSTKRTIVSGLTAIATLDLSQIKRKIMEPAPEGKGWNQATADEAEKWYRRYLEVCLRHPDFPAVPNRLIDDFWHQHILDTRAYATDCQNVFGEFLHHYPYFGLNGDAPERDSAFNETDQIYRKLFGESCIGGGNSCKVTTVDRAVGASCNHSGSGTGCGQGGRGGRALPPAEHAVGASCNHSGSGTGCGQGGGRSRAKAGGTTCNSAMRESGQASCNGTHCHRGGKRPLAANNPQANIDHHAETGFHELHPVPFNS